MDLEVRHLRLIAEIASAGSMTRAADRLYLTQSALSHQLRDIESRFKTQFFTRLGRRMVLTPAGDRLLVSARRVLTDLEQAEQDVRGLAGGGEGVIRVCTQCNTGYHWLAPLLATFQRKFPKIAVNVLADATDKPVEALHVSQNLGIPFTELKSHMVTVTSGTAGAPPTATQTGSLGQAIQASKATVDAPTAVMKAESQADADLRTTTSTTAGSSSTSSSTRTKPKKTTSGGSR